MNIKETINNYLTERFNYNPEIDLRDDEEAKNSLDEFEYQVRYYRNKNFHKTILDNLDYKFFIPCLTLDNEKTSAMVIMFEWDLLAHIDGIEDKIINIINNLSEEEINELKSYKEIGINILEIYYFYFGNFTSIDYDFEIKHIGGQPVSMKLKDPFYTFPELDFMKKIKSMFNLSSNRIVELFKEEVYDYASHCVGEYNADGREEFLMYYHDFLEKEILSDKKDMDKQIQIDTLKGYLKELKDIKRRLSVLDCCKDIPNELQYTLVSMKKDLEAKVKDIPARYRKIEVIQKKLDLLVN